MARALIAFLALFFRRVALPCHVCLTTQRIPASLDRRASVIRIEHSAQVRGDAELYWHARRHRFAVEARRVGGRGPSCSFRASIRASFRPSPMRGVSGISGHGLSAAWPTARMAGLPGCGHGTAIAAALACRVGHCCNTTERAPAAGHDWNILECGSKMHFVRLSSNGALGVGVRDRIALFKMTANPVL